MVERKIKKSRETKETTIELELNLDGKGVFNINTTIPFLDHMLSLFSKHSFIDLTINAKGDTEVDFHHLVEDIGIVLGTALKDSVFQNNKFNRFGFTQIPMDNVLCSVTIDICNRPNLVFNIKENRGKVGDFDFELIEEFFNAVSNNSGMTIHINHFYGSNLHHISESIFKSFGVSLKQAVEINERLDSVRSTKKLI